MASKYLRTILSAAMAVSVLTLPVTASAAAPRGKVETPKCGGASWYALTSKTASGERMNASLLTAAHRSLKFGTKVKVTNKHNGKSVVVRINDRGPFHGKRIIDLSKAAARDIGMIKSGVGQVCYQIVS